MSSSVSLEAMFVWRLFADAKLTFAEADLLRSNIQNPLHTFPRNFPVDREVAVLLATSRCNGIWEKRHDTTDTTDVCPRQLLQTWCNGFWP